MHIGSSDYYQLFESRTLGGIVRRRRVTRVRANDERPSLALVRSKDPVLSWQRTYPGHDRREEIRIARHARGSWTSTTLGPTNTSLARNPRVATERGVTYVSFYLGGRPLLAEDGPSGNWRFRIHHFHQQALPGYDPVVAVSAGHVVVAWTWYDSRANRSSAIAAEQTSAGWIYTDLTPAPGDLPESLWVPNDTVSMLFSRSGRATVFVQESSDSPLPGSNYTFTRSQQ